MSYIAPEFDVQIALGFDPLNRPTSGDWVSFGPPREFSFDRGRQDDLDEYRPGRMSLTLDNADESLDQLDPASPLYADALPSTPIRLVCTLDGDTQILFDGYTIDGFNPSGSRGAGVVDVEAHDWLGWATSIESPDSQWAAWVQRVDPSVWIRGYTTRSYIDLASNPSGVAFNMAAILSGSGGDMYGSTIYTDDVYRNESSSLAPGSSAPHFEMGVGGFGGIDTGVSIPKTGRWLAAGWFNTTDPASLVWGGTDWNVHLDASGYLVADVNIGGFIVSATVSQNHCLGLNKMWTLKVQSTGGTRYVYLESDMGFQNTVSGPAATSGGGVLGFRGESGAETGEFAYFENDTLLGYLFGITDVDGMSGENWAGDGLGGRPIANPVLWSHDTTDERVVHLLPAHGVPAPDYEVLMDDPSLELTEYRTGSTLAGQVARLGENFLGGAYMKRDGTLRIRDWSFTSDTPDHFDYEAATITDDPAAVDGITTTTVLSDTFTRADSATIGGSWDVTPPGQFGIISNSAYVFAADATDSSAVVRYMQTANHKITATISGAVSGQGVVVRYEDEDNYVAALYSSGFGTYNIISRQGGVDTSIGFALATSFTISLEAVGSIVRLTQGSVTDDFDDPGERAGARAGLIFEPNVTPANTARWDDVTITNESAVIRATERSRTGTRLDRVVNAIEVDFGGGNIYYQDADSVRRYGFRRKSFTSEADNKDDVEPIVQSVLAEKKDPPTHELGELVIRPYGNQAATNWVCRNLELDVKVPYREATYRGGVEVIDSDHRVAHEQWDFSNGVNDWTVTVKLVPA